MIELTLTRDQIVKLWIEQTVDLSTALPVTMGIMTEPLNVHWYQAQTKRETAPR